MFDPHAMKIYGGSGKKLHTSLTLALVEGEWLASRSGHFTF
jgi:hypothetical protein